MFRYITLYPFLNRQFVISRNSHRFKTIQLQPGHFIFYFLLKNIYNGRQQWPGRLVDSYDSFGEKKNRLITIFYGGARGTSKITETISQTY